MPDPRANRRQVFRANTALPFLPCVPRVGRGGGRSKQLPGGKTATPRERNRRLRFIGTDQDRNEVTLDASRKISAQTCPNMWPVIPTRTAIAATRIPYSTIVGASSSRANRATLETSLDMGMTFSGGDGFIANHRKNFLRPRFLSNAKTMPIPRRGGRMVVQSMANKRLVAYRMDLRAVRDRGRSVDFRQPMLTPRMPNRNVMIVGTSNADAVGLENFA